MNDHCNYVQSLKKKIALERDSEPMTSAKTDAVLSELRRQLV